MFDLLFVTASRTRQIAPAKLEPAMFFGGGRHQAGGTRWPQILPHFRRLCSPRGFCPRASSSTGRPRQMEVRICRRKRQQTTSPVAGEVGQRGCFEAARCVPAKTSLASKTPSFTGVSPRGSTPPPPPTSTGSPKVPRSKFETAQNIRDSEASRERFFGMAAIWRDSDSGSKVSLQLFIHVRQHLAEPHSRLCGPSPLASSPSLPFCW